MEHKIALENFLKHLDEKGRSKSTMIAYKKDIEQLLEHYSKEVLTVKDFQTNHIQIYIERLVEEKKFTLKTISRKINSYKTFFKFLNREKILDTDIAHPISHPSFKPKDPRILSSFEYKALRDTARNNPRLYAMIELLLQTGIRIGELSRLKLNDINLESDPPVISIAEFSSNPARSIVLNKQAKDAIEVYLKDRPTPKNDNGFVFITKNGNQVLVRNMRTMINSAFKKSGIEDATVNDIRNTFIVFQLENGMPLERVADVVGHKRITSTEKYLNLLKNKQSPITKKIVAL